MDCWDRQYFKGGVNKERGFPGGSVVKNLPANAGDVGDVDLTPGSGSSPGEGNGNLCQYFWLENSLDRGVWWATELHTGP